MKIKINVPIISYPTRYRQFQKNIKKIKKIKKKKNTISASFQAKTRWERPQKSENKIFVMGISFPIRNREFKKKKQENSKNYKTPIWPLFRPKQVGKG